MITEGRGWLMSPELICLHDYLVLLLWYVVSGGCLDVLQRSSHFVLIPIVPSMCLYPRISCPYTSSLFHCRPLILQIIHHCSVQWFHVNPVTQSGGPGKQPEVLCFRRISSPFVVQGYFYLGFQCSCLSFMTFTRVPSWATCEATLEHFPPVWVG